MQTSNVNACPHGDHKHTIRTSDGRTAILCDHCNNDLLDRLSDRAFVGMMIKSTMPTGEYLRVGFERSGMEAGVCKELPRCEWCNRSCYPNQLKESPKMGDMVCDTCRADDGPDMRLVEPVSLVEFPEVQPCQQ